MAPEKRHIIHAVEILGVFALAHHFWPKGITYGEKEPWEIRHRERLARSQSTSSRSQSTSTRSRSVHPRTPESRRVDHWRRDVRYDDDFEDGGWESEGVRESRGMEEGFAGRSRGAGPYSRRGSFDEEESVAAVVGGKRRQRNFEREDEYERAPRRGQSIDIPKTIPREVPRYREEMRAERDRDSGEESEIRRMREWEFEERRPSRRERRGTERW